ncbi:MAG: hypothetical protein FGF51_01350 [Candidatus Brockarchaeota archaeon]|nr:hypothetical protein [Candidatus Brockarchaeota archaeon]
MVTAGKIFRLDEYLPQSDIAQRLKGYRVETPLEGVDLSLVTEIAELKASQNMLEGVISRDVPLTIRRRDRTEIVAKTVDSVFSFVFRRRRVFLIVLEKKPVANMVANMFSQVIFLKSGRIVEARISPEVMLNYHNANSDAAKVVFFDDVDIPNIKKLSLYGPSLANTSLFTEYLKHGNIWYIVIAHRKTGLVAGITRDAVVTIFSRIDPSSFIRFSVEEIIPLIEESEASKPERKA